MSVVLDGDAAVQDISLPVCVECVHLLGDGRCTAFPKEIPLEILLHGDPHLTPFPGDNGIQFEKEEL